MIKDYPGNKDFVGVDKVPGEEKNRGETVTTRDLKGKWWMLIHQKKKSSY